MTTTPPSPYVLVTVGTDFHPFDRLVHWSDEWSQRNPDVGCFIQSGTSQQTFSAPGAPFLPYEDLLTLLSGALGVVTHGGPATIMQIRAQGLVPIVMPRRKEYGEHVDDHQLRFSSRLAAVGDLVLVEGSQELHAALDRLVRSPEEFRLEPDRSSVALAVEEFAFLVDHLMASRGRGGWLRRVRGHG